MALEKCHCGRPLHYTNPENKALVDKLIAMCGEFIPVTGPDGRVWNVPRHFIALHGLKASELSSLGFEEIKE